MAWIVVLCAMCGYVSAGSEQSDAAENKAAVQYIEAQSQIASAQYADALATLRSLQLHYPAYSKIATVQSRIAVLHEYRDASDVMPLFMQALDYRDEKRSQQAVDTLDSVAMLPSGSALADDALYLKAYIQVMDLYRFADARASIEQLRIRFPDTAYFDSAAYLDAIALEQSGHTDQARLALRLLRERHTALRLPFGFRWPVSGVLSRYWFERADQRLAILSRHGEDAAQLRGKQRSGNGSIIIDVAAEGQTYSLTLQPSPVTNKVQWTDENLDVRSPPALAVYSGMVTNEPGSWARVVIDGQAVSGMISINGQRFILQPDQLIGTMDYYKSGTRSEGDTEPQRSDYLSAPDPVHSQSQVRASETRMTRLRSSTRLVSLSVVVDAAFDNYYGGQGVAQALNNINMADGIYREQGLALAIDKVQSLSADTSPVVTDSTGTLESLLKSFRDYRMQQSVLYDNSQLVYLFTGADTVDRTLGLAWIDTLCRLDGYDVGVTTPSTYANVLTTHELGHSFGALHDSDTECAADSGKIMWPRLSNNTLAEFSGCSVEKVELARSSQCLSDAIDLQLSASLSPAAVILSVLNSDSVLPVTARVRIEAVDVEIQWPASCVVQTLGSADCVLTNVGASASFEIELMLNRDIDTRAGQINAQVVSDLHDPDPINNAVSIDLVTGLITQSMPFSDPVSSSAPQVASSGGSGSLQVMTLLLFLLLILARLQEVSTKSRVAQHHRVRKAASPLGHQLSVGS